MAEKEQIIYVRQYGEDNPCDTCEDKNGDECDFCVKNYEWNASITRTEAIKRMAKAMRDIALTGHYSRFEDSCIIEDAIPYAEAALNALLEKEDNK